MESVITYLIRMNFRSSIKSRIIIGFLAFSTLLTLLFAISSLSIRQYLQNDFMAQTIQEDLDNYLLKLSSNPVCRVFPFTTLKPFALRKKKLSFHIVNAAASRDTEPPLNFSPVSRLSRVSTSASPGTWFAARNINPSLEARESRERRGRIR